MAKKPIIRYFDRGVWYDATVSDIGNLEELNTVHKTTVVEAINDIVGGNFAISGNLLDMFNELDESIAGLDEMISNGALNENQAEQINQFVIEKLNELNQSMEELNKQREQRLKEQEEKVAQLKLDSESDKQRIEEITEDLNATKEKLNNAELNVTSVTHLVDEINGKISQAVSRTDFDLLEGTVREQKTLIDQTAEGIKLLATKEELDKSNEDVKKIKSELDVQAGLIESKVSSEQLINEVEKIDKYMPNLLRYTRNWQDWENNDKANVDVTLNEYRDCIIQRARGIGKGLSTTVEDLAIGETYSLSVWVKHDDTNAKLYAMVDNEEIIMTDLNSKETFVGNEFKRMRCSFVAKDTTAKVRFIFKNCRTDSYGYLAGAKCEKNKKVSGWQPNSEDVYESIKSARSEIKQTDDKITTLVETVTKQGDLISSNKSNIEQTDKDIKLQAESIKTLNESIESAKSELKVSSDAIKSKVWKTDIGEMISDINIDNKNRVLNSDFGDGWELWSETNNLFQLKQIGNYKFAVAERSGLSQNMAIAIATNKFPVKHNERLMFGFYFYCADLSKLDNKIVGALELLDINDIRIDRVDFDVSKLSLKNGSFTKLTDTYFVEDERIVKARLRFFLNRNGNIGFALPMAQGGDIKSSDWSLAPEDVARRFNDTNVTITNYEQTVNGFKQTVESYKGSVDGYSNQVSEFNQTVNGFNQDITTYKNNLNGRIDQLQTSLNTESGRITAVVVESSKTKNDLATLTGENGRIAQLELTANGLKSTVTSQSSSIQTIQTDTTNAKQLANDAYSKASSAVTSASNASSTASSALTKASDASSVANSASQNANNAVASANSAVSTANTAKSNADKAIADVATLTKTVSSQSTRIDQTSNRIDLVANGITEVGNKLDNLQVGGRNLALNSGREVKNRDYRLSYYYISPSEGELLSNGYGYLVDRKKYTIVICLTTDSTVGEIRPFLSGGFQGLGIISLEKNKKQVVSLDFIARYYGGRYPSDSPEYAKLELYRYPNPYDISGADYVTVHWVKIVDASGVVVKDWSPAPEDNKSRIDEMNNNLSNNYYQKTAVDSKLSTAVSGITAQYTQDINTKLGNYYDKSTIDSKLTIDGTGISTYVKSTQTQLNNLSIGADNLIVNGGFPTDTHGWGKEGQGNGRIEVRKHQFYYNESKNLFCIINNTVGKEVTAYSKLFYVKPNTDYTLSFIGFSSSNVVNTEVHYLGRINHGDTSYSVITTLFNNIIMPSGTCQYYQITFNSRNSNEGYIRFDNNGSTDGNDCYMFFGEVMLVEGNVAKKYQPSSADTNNKIDGVSGRLDDLGETLTKIDTWKNETAESFIQQTANSLSTLIKDKNGSSLMRFDSTSATWSFNTDVLEKNISDAKDAGDKAQKTANEANELAEGLKNLLNDIQNKTAYITMATYNGQPCIELGKTDNKFKVRITNESVDFLDGSTRVAYVSNNQLYIDKAIVKNEFQIGEGTGFIWKKRSNGNMGLRWGG